MGQAQDLPDLTPKLLSQARVIAKGKAIREVRRLVTTYGGRASAWVKKSSPKFEVDGELAEYHWYQHPGLPRVEVTLVKAER